MRSHNMLRAPSQPSVPQLTFAGAVLDLVVEELGHDEQVCDEVEDACNYLVWGGEGGGGEWSEFTLGSSQPFIPSSRTPCNILHIFTFEFI